MALSFPAMGPDIINAKTAPKEKDKLSENLKKSAKAKDTPAPAPKEVVKKIRDPKIVKALKKLKLKNDYLIKEKSEIQAKDDKEKELLNKEIKTLKKEYTERKGSQTYNDKTSVLEDIIQEKTAEIDGLKKQLKGGR